MQKINIGEKLLSARKAQKLSRRAISEKAGISERTLQRYENGERTPTIKTSEKIADALDMTLNDLLSEDEYFAAYNDAGVPSKQIPPYVKIIRATERDRDLKEKIAGKLDFLNRAGLKRIDAHIDDLLKAPDFIAHDEKQTITQIFHRKDEINANKNKSSDTDE